MSTLRQNNKNITAFKRNRCTGSIVYVVLLFKATDWTGSLCSSDEGRMEWIEYSRLPEIETVADLDELLKVMNSPELTEFQYLVSNGDWTVSTK